MVLIVLGRQSQNQRSIPGKGNAKREVKSDTKVDLKLLRSFRTMLNQLQQQQTPTSQKFAGVARVCLRHVLKHLKTSTKFRRKGKQ